MPQAFANLDGLLRLSRTEGVDIRPPLLRVLTDLYVQEQTHTREEERQYSELALQLLPVVDIQTRVAVARKLVAHPVMPPAVADYLLTAIPDLATSIGQADLPPAGSSAQARAAQDSERLAPANAPREPFRAQTSAVATDAAPLGELFMQAGPAERAHLLQRLEENSDEPIATTVRPEIRSRTIERLERIALQRNQREFARELQTILRVSNRIAWRIVQDEFGEPLLIAAREIGIPDDVLLRILLFLNPTVGESVERVFALMRLYDGLSSHAAAPIVAAWREDARARAAAKFQPANTPDSAELSSSVRGSVHEPSSSIGQSGAKPTVPDTRDRRQDAV